MFQDIPREMAAPQNYRRVKDLYYNHLNASSTVLGIFLFKVSGRVHIKNAELSERAEKIIRGICGDIRCASIGVKGARMLPIRPTTEHMLKNLCLRLVGNSSIVKM